MIDIPPQRYAAQLAHSRELGWFPRHSALDALQAFFDGLREGVDLDTPPLARDTGGPMRIQEYTTRIGQRP